MLLHASAFCPDQLNVRICIAVLHWVGTLQSQHAPVCQDERAQPQRQGAQAGQQDQRRESLQLPELQVIGNNCPASRDGTGGEQNVVVAACFLGLARLCNREKRRCGCLLSRETNPVSLFYNLGAGRCGFFCCCNQACVVLLLLIA